MKNDERVRVTQSFITEDGHTFKTSEEASRHLLEVDFEDALFDHGTHATEATSGWVADHLLEILGVAENHGLCVGQVTLKGVERVLQNICTKYEAEDMDLVATLVNVLGAMGLDSFYPHKVPSRA